KFEDITEQAGVAGRDSSISTGSTMADVDEDGDLDIYVCNTGHPDWSIDRRNQLFINDGSGVFTESAEAFGLDSESYSNHATFFDYDRDGDLDMYLLNHPTDFSRANQVRHAPHQPEEYATDLFFRNDGDHFTDVSAEAGIQNFAFGLSATAGDINGDGWMDVFVANDYVIPDFLYLNNGDGTFTESGMEAMPHTAHSGMGSDVADINNDGLLDIVILDMMAEDSRRQRLLGSMMKYDRYEILKQYGYGEQIQRNMLHLNNGDGTFSEVGQLAGISTTDWSWGALVADYDLDGYRDIFIVNGYRHDVTNQDYMKFTLDSLKRAGGGRVTLEEGDIYQYLDQIPSEKLSNYAYRNRGDLTFEDVSSLWGLDDETFSNGAAYADLDGDGDLDLVVNDIDGTARLYRNMANHIFGNRHWLEIAFEGPPGNPFGIGARVTIENEVGQQQVGENISSRGFFSSVPPELAFGLGEDGSAVSVTVVWPDGKWHRSADVSVDQRVTLDYSEATDSPRPYSPTESPLFAEAVSTGISFTHLEDAFIDFRRDLLIPHMHSREGPPLAASDVNGDGLDDLFVGGAAGQAGQLFLQQGDGSFQTAADAPFLADASSEDTRALFFDANGDGVLDLYVASGGSHLTSQDESAAQAYQDRLYMGDGQGGFQPAEGSLPLMPVPTGAVAAGDVDGDGDADLFVGGRVVPGRWPESPRSYLLINEGGRFTDQTEALAPGLAEVGLVTGAAFADVDGDGSEELVIAGEWMAPQVWSANGSGGLDLVAENGLGAYMGWWNTLSAVDVDGDGDVDLLGGNLGLNSRIRGSLEEPVHIYAKDFDNNGSLDPILTLVYPDGGEYPIHRREMMMKQLPYLQQRFPRYGRYAASTLSEVFRASELEDALTREAGWFSSTWFENDGAGQFIAHALPIEAQVAPIYAFVMRDVNGDGHVDLIAAGNNRFADVERGPYDAGRGLVLLGNGQGGWESVPTRRHGLALSGDVRSLVWLRNSSNGWLVAGNNDAPVQVRAIGNGS
ncbi:MAG: VCBS repeat-containing protein, partial [Bacteroidetes bacterium]|nr:VCBS repeat-containing protein [Bacteroidota bacterium]